MSEGVGNFVAQRLRPKELLVRKKGGEGWTRRRIERALFEQAVNRRKT
jgi:hypothetical protein